FIVPRRWLWYNNRQDLISPSCLLVAMRRTTFLPLVLACLVLPLPNLSAGTPAEDETILKEAKVPSDAASLIQFFRKRVLPENDAVKVKDLIDKLGSETFRVRERASARLVALGPGVARALRDATGNGDPEIVCRAREALEIVE